LKLIRLTVILVTLTILTITHAYAQQEFPPPQGKGRVVVVISGILGPSHDQSVTPQIAQLGYDAVLFDGNRIVGTHGAALRTMILQAQGMPHALPGKVGLVGFSLGGGMVLYYGPLLTDLVAVVVAWSPETNFIHNVPGFVSRLALPVLMFAGEADTYHNCCLAGTARILAAAAVAAGHQFELVTYPNANHDFIYGGAHYNPQVYAAAMQRTAAKLAQYIGH